MFTSIFKFLVLFLNVVSTILEKYSAKKTEEKYEQARNNSNSVWVDGFGVRREKTDHPSSPNTEQ